MDGIGIGESDFKMLRLRDYYFIDKSLYIKDIIDNKSKVLLITRSRRFGKTLKNSIKNLSEYLSRHFDKKVMLFLDEYDVPLQNTYIEGYYDKAVKFFKTFYGVTFKDN